MIWFWVGPLFQFYLLLKLSKIYRILLPILSQILVLLCLPFSLIMSSVLLTILEVLDLQNHYQYRFLPNFQSHSLPTPTYHFNSDSMMLYPYLVFQLWFSSFLRSFYQGCREKQLIGLQHFLLVLVVNLIQNLIDPTYLNSIACTIEYALA